jgi:16S rRNA (uracil1498-N3)-methyltransferase
MARLFVDPSQLCIDSITIADEDHRYLTRVLRLGIGDTVVLFDGRGGEADVRIVRIGPRALEARVEARRTLDTPLRPDLMLIQSLTKGDKFEFVIQKATELGVTRLLPVTSSRSIQRIDHTRALGRQVRWRKIVREAARQCGRADVPEIEPVTSIETALDAAPKDALKLLFWEGARQKSLKKELPATRPACIVVAIGPEGGFSLQEVDAARAAGFIVVGMGPRILRAETAAVTALSIVGYVLGDLGETAQLLDPTAPPG